MNFKNYSSSIQTYTPPFPTPSSKQKSLIQPIPPPNLPTPKPIPYTHPLDSTHIYTHTHAHNQPRKSLAAARTSPHSLYR